MVETSFKGRVTVIGHRGETAAIKERRRFGVFQRACRWRKKSIKGSWMSAMAEAERNNKVLQQRAKFNTWMVRASLQDDRFGLGV